MSARKSDRPSRLANLSAIAFSPTKNKVILTMIEPRSVPDLLKAPIPDTPEGKQRVRLLACGKLDGVNSIIYNLHVIRFAEVGEWSPPLPSPVTGEVIRILTRYIRLL